MTSKDKLAWDYAVAILTNYEKKASLERFRDMETWEVVYPSDALRVVAKYVKDTADGWPCSACIGPTLAISHGYKNMMVGDIANEKEEAEP